MAEIRVLVDGNEYTKEQFKKDLVRMFDICRKSNGNDEDIGEATCRGVNCDACPLSSVCNTAKYMSFETIKTVHEWAQEHPIATNRDVLKRLLGKMYLLIFAQECLNMNGLIKSIKNHQKNQRTTKMTKKPHKEP